MTEETRVGEAQNALKEGRHCFIIETGVSPDEVHQRIKEASEKKHKKHREDSLRASESFQDIRWIHKFIFSGARDENDRLVSSTFFWKGEGTTVVVELRASRRFYKETLNYLRECISEAGLKVLKEY